MFWESPVDYEDKKRTIGDGSKIYEEPEELFIDGQQRLTALVAASNAVIFNYILYLIANP